MWSAYLRKISGNAPQKDIAARVGVSQPTISRWLDGSLKPNDAATAAHVARQYDSNPLVAFVAADMLTIDEAGRGLTMRDRTLLVELGAEDPDINHRAARRRRPPPPPPEDDP